MGDNDKNGVEKNCPLPYAPVVPQKQLLQAPVFEHTGSYLPRPEVINPVPPVQEVLLFQTRVEFTAEHGARL